LPPSNWEYLARNNCYFSLAFSEARIEIAKVVLFSSSFLTIDNNIMNRNEISERWRALQELLLALPLEDVKYLRRHIVAIEKYLMKKLERSKEQ
jgi:hypothetical protein